MCTLVRLSIFQERAELLRRWVSSGENLQQCEHSINVSRSTGVAGRRKVALVAVKDMGKPPYSFSQPLDLTPSRVFVCPCTRVRHACLSSRSAVQIRRKIEYIISTRQGVEAWSKQVTFVVFPFTSRHTEDRDAPGIAEETRYWVTIEESHTDYVDTRLFFMKLNCVLQQGGFSDSIPNLDTSTT